MFPVISKSSDGTYDYIDLLVHLDYHSYRRSFGEDRWMILRHGNWEYEGILDEIISELFNDNNQPSSEMPPVIAPSAPSTTSKKKMAWEWNWPNSLWDSAWQFTFLDINLEWRRKGDHSPGFHCLVVCCNFKLLDFGYYNIYHEDEWL